MNRRVIIVDDNDGGQIIIHVEQITAVRLMKNGHIRVNIPPGIIEIENKEECTRFENEYYAWLNEDTE